jgi:murein DD-endopeptidase MepM/ murein hydrolase activator NlpD
MFLRDILLVLSMWFAVVPPAQADTVSCTGQFKQAGLLTCTARPNSVLNVSGPDRAALRKVPVNAAGVATIGLLRNETLDLTIRPADNSTPGITVILEKRDDPFRTIEGLDCDKVDARTPEQKAHAGRSWVTKQYAFKTFSNGPGAAEGFIRPVDGPMSSPFGPARKYIGVGKDGEPCDKTSIHYGYDVAVPVGTSIFAPASGTVTLGDPDLYYEGGTVFLDHGEGLVSVFMHMSEVSVVPGQVLKQGERLGASGNTGRTTGPHLHWAVKWRNSLNDDRGRDFYIDPAVLLDFEPAP